MHDMGAFVRNDALRRLRQMRPYRELVAHSPAHDQQRRFMTGQVGDVAFQVIRDCVFTEHIIEKARVRDGMEHGCSGRCDDIA